MYSPFDLILDVLFPKLCFVCYLPGTYLCSNCTKKHLDFLPQQRCPLCNKPSTTGATHTRCSSPLSIDGVYATTTKNQLATKLIQQLKYQFASQLTPTISSLISQHYPFPSNRFDILTAIPLHPQRYRWRGFNQSHLIGQSVARKKQLYYLPDLLIRTQLTTPQAEIPDRQQRLQNIRKAFQINPLIAKAQVKNHHILIIDDVTTTGATLNQAAHPLKRAGAKSVWGLVFCR